MLDLRRLQVLAAVIEAGSVTDAAIDLGYSPSSVSQQLAVLAKEAGVVLFEKNGRGIRATDAGLVLAEHAQHVLRAVADAEQAMADIRDGRTGRVRIMSFVSAADSLMPVVVAHLRRTHPGMVVEATVGEEDQAERALRENQLEIALVLGHYARGAEPSDDLVRIHLLDDPYRAMLPEGHPLARKESVALVEMAKEPWVAAQGGNGFYRDETIDVCRRAGFTPRFAAHAVEYPAAQAYVATGIGVGLVPELALGVVHEGVEIRPLVPEPERRHVWAITRPAVAHTPAVQAALEALRIAVREHEDRIAERPHVVVAEALDEALAD